MEMIYQNETLYIEMWEDLTEQDYLSYRRRIFRIIDDYGVDKVIVEHHHQIFHNRYFLNQMKQDFYLHYQGEFQIK